MSSRADRWDQTTLESTARTRPTVALPAVRRSLGPSGEKENAESDASEARRRSPGVAVRRSEPSHAPAVQRPRLRPGTGLTDSKLKAAHEKTPETAVLQGSDSVQEWARRDSNPQLLPCKGSTLAVELHAPRGLAARARHRFAQWHLSPARMLWKERRRRGGNRLAISRACCSRIGSAAAGSVTGGPSSAPPGTHPPSRTRRCVRVDPPPG